MDIIIHKFNTSNKKEPVPIILRILTIDCKKEIMIFLDHQNRDCIWDNVNSLFKITISAFQFFIMVGHDIYSSAIGEDLFLRSSTTCEVPFCYEASITCTILM